MAYPNYNFYPSYYQQTPAPGINWVQGIEGAKAFPIATGATAMLMDSEASVFYIKASDASGMPTLKVYDYKEREAESAKPEYVTREELEKAIADLKKPAKKGKDNE